MALELQLGSHCGEAKSKDVLGFLSLNKVERTGGSLHESSVHECLKSSLAFRKPGMTAVSGRMARADGL